MTRHRLMSAAVAVWLWLPGTAHALAELEVTEYSRGSAGASATLGYFELSDPDLVSHTETLTPAVDGTGDVMAEYTYLYRDSVRVNAGHFGGGAVIPFPMPGHSYAKASGYADAGASTLGGYTNMGAFAYVFAGDSASTASAISNTKIEFTFVIGAGGSGAAAGDPATGLRWAFGTDGDLSVWGTTDPQRTATSASGEFHAMILRGPTGLCGPFLLDCQRNAYAASVDLSTSIVAQSRTPNSPGDPTGQVTRDRQWDARNNSTLWGGGTLITQGGEYNELVGLAHGENDPLAYGSGIHTGGFPLGLDFIDFDATVGETLKLTADLTAAASLGGVGGADADMFGSFSTRVFDPLGRGYDISFSMAPVPEPETWVLLLAGLGLMGFAARRHRSHEFLHALHEPALLPAARRIPRRGRAGHDHDRGQRGRPQT